jgi:hypothetical protein
MVRQDTTQILVERSQFVTIEAEDGSSKGSVSVGIAE